MKRLLILCLCLALLPVTAFMEGEIMVFDTPALSGKNARQMLKNPDRGFRIENYMNVDSGRNGLQSYTVHGDYLGPNMGEDAIGALMNRLYDYNVESPTVSQMYFYLTEYRDRDLDQTAFDNMNAFFQACRQQKITLALRFAYIVTQGQEAKQEPSLEQMLRHMEQLKPLLAENRDVLFCLEAGFFGEWGEQSGIAHWRGEGKVDEIMNAIVRMCPADLPIVVRYDWVRQETAATMRHRVGYHDDYIVGFSHAWSFGSTWDSEDFQRVQKNCERVLMEGEMPWAQQCPDMDPWAVVKYTHDLHFTALSCYHNYREGGGKWILWQARELEATPETLAQHGLSVPYDAWFQDLKGQPLKRTLFDYVRDFLGYHIQASDAKASIQDSKVRLSLNLTNYGFAAPLALEDIEAVLVNEAGEIVSRASLCTLNKLTAGESLTCTAALDLPDGGAYRLGVYIHNHAGTGAKMANDIPFENGVNILGEVQ
ncbi:MAG: DUF4874 domain-containing protein [Clostridiales bacterium]|nr:DUF4874 domain-containing protein [Clostridiales bacterium]